jgi:hypothetical protein
VGQDVDSCQVLKPFVDLSHSFGSRCATSGGAGTKREPVHHNHLRRTWGVVSTNQLIADTLCQRGLWLVQVAWPLHVLLVTEVRFEDFVQDQRTQ